MEVGKKRFFKRLCEGSLIISCLSKISRGLIHYLRISVFSSLFSNGESLDAALGQGAVGGAFGRLKLQSRLSRPVKTFFAYSVERSVLVGFYRKAVRRALYTPVSSFGAFLFTLGFYISMTYVLRLYAIAEINRVFLESAGLTAAKPVTAVTGGALLLFSLPLLFCRKSLAQMLAESAFFSAAFSGTVDFDHYRGERRHPAAGLAIIAGLVLGTASFFLGETTVLLLLGLVLFSLIVLYSPETGLFAAALIFPFCQPSVLAALISYTFISYLFKALRGKRNMRFGAADVFTALLSLCFLSLYAFGGGGGAAFAFSMTALYFLAAKLLATPALLRKCVSALTLGLGLCLAAAACQLFFSAVAGDTAMSALPDVYSVFGNGEGFSKYLLVILPFILCKTDSLSFSARPIGYLALAFFMFYSLLNGSLVFALFAAAEAALYFAVCDRRFFRPLIFCFGAPAALLYFTKAAVSFESPGLSDVYSGWAASLTAGARNLLFGAGMSGPSLSLTAVADSRSMYLQIFLECGFLGFLLLVLALASAAGRLYAFMGERRSGDRRLAAATGASALTGFILGVFFNLWNESGVCFVFWLCLGLSAARYGVRKTEAVDDGI